GQPRAPAAGQPVRAVAGLSDPLHGGGVRAAGYVPGTHPALVAGGGAESGSTRLGGVLADLCTLAAARHPERRLAGLCRCAQGNARDPADASLRLGYPGGTHPRPYHRRRLDPRVPAGANPGGGRVAAGYCVDPALRAPLNRGPGEKLPKPEHCGYNQALTLSPQGAAMGKRTPLYDRHLAAGARMVDFGGWDMPLHYGSQIEEHHQVRRDAGMFDVSHMAVVDATG